MLYLYACCSAGQTPSVQTQNAKESRWSMKRQSQNVNVYICTNCTYKAYYIVTIILYIRVLWLKNSWQNNKIHCCAKIWKQCEMSAGQLPSNALRYDDICGVWIERSSITLRYVALSFCCAYMKKQTRLTDSLTRLMRNKLITSIYLYE